MSNKVLYNLNSSSWRVTFANIKKRGRNYEQEIPAEYLEKINKGYLDYIKSQPDLNVLIIDVSDKDFVKKQPDYVDILEQIRSKLSV